MKKININPTDLSYISWNKVLENSAIKSEMSLNNFYLLSYPIQTETKLKFSLLEKSHSAVLIPSNLIGFSNQ